MLEDRTPLGLLTRLAPAGGERESSEAVSDFTDEICVPFV